MASQASPIRSVTGEAASAAPSRDAAADSLLTSPLLIGHRTPSGWADARDQHLNRVASGDSKVALVVFGLPGAGKSTVMAALADQMQLALPERLMPRERRDSDAPTEQHWTPEQQATAQNWAAIPFAHKPFANGWYAFAGDRLLNQLATTGAAGVFLQIGHPYDVLDLCDGMQSAYPLMPLAAIRVSAPLTTLEARLRATRSPDEVTQRVHRLRASEDRDREQMPGLSAVIPLLDLNNISARELAALTEAPANAVDAMAEPGRLAELVGAQIDRAKASAAEIARDVLRKRTLDPNDSRIPRALVEILDSRVVDEFARFGVDFAVFAGVGAVIYGSPRTVSNDLDVQVIARPELALGLRDAVEAVTGQEAPIHRFVWDIAPCIGARGMAQSEAAGPEVAIDGNLIMRVAFNPQGFCYEFPLDGHDKFMCRTIVLPSGNEVQLSPPEHIVMHKLAMGRGADVEKFDLLDAAAIIAHNPVDPNMIHKLLYVQRFCEQRDGFAVDPAGYRERFAAVESHYVKLRAFLLEVGVTDEGIREKLANWIGAANSDDRLNPIPRAELLGMKLTAIKQAALVCRCLTSLDRLADEVGRVPNVDASTFQSRIDLWRSVLTFYGKFELGQWNTTHFVGRGAWTDRLPIYSASTSESASVPSIPLAVAKSYFPALAWQAHRARAIELTRGMPTIPNSVIDVLEGTFPAAARASGFEPLITSGLAAAIYGSPRPASADIDFTLQMSEAASSQVGSVLSAIMGRELVAAQFTGGIAPCLGIRAHTNSPTSGEKVDLDGLVVVRFQPYKGGFSFEFEIDQDDVAQACKISLPNGETVGVVPPEHVLYYKLLACRGADIGKFDLADAAGILANVPLNPEMLAKLVTHQRFSETRGEELIDPARLIESIEQAALKGEQHTRAVLFEAGIRDQALLSMLTPCVSMAAFSSPKRSAQTLDLAKQVAMVSRLLEGLNRVQSELDVKVQRIDGSSISPGELYDRASIAERIEATRSFLCSLAGELVATRDIAS